MIGFYVVMIMLLVILIAGEVMHHKEKIIWSYMLCNVIAICWCSYWLTVRLLGEM